MYGTSRKSSKVDPTDTIHSSDAIKKARGDGFFNGYLGDSAATCQAHSYRDSVVEGKSELVWRVEIPAE